MLPSFININVCGFRLFKFCLVSIDDAESCLSGCVLRTAVCVSHAGQREPSVRQE